ncbi:MAG: DNA-binding response regulator, partial [Actinobacteria bacterium]|nr:DNA-binding response regulator [Actinomycetota bacterium]
MKNPKVLIVDDEKNIRDLLEAGLKFAGFSVYSVGTGTEAVTVAEKAKPDIMILDVMLPDQSGFSVTKKLRSMNIDLPVLFLSARDDRGDKVTGLTVGGDDYMTKPFSIDEVIARIHAILRRTKKQDAEDSIIEVGEIKINQDAHEVFVNGTEIDLSP